MSAALTVARKELRALFQSPMALVFLVGFLLAVLFVFFGYSRFFARGLADVRPLFQWLPLLLIFLVSAITMRSWAEERRAGTLEVLLTLPIRTTDLVLGKFLAGMALVSIALVLTGPLPLTAWLLGPLDLGPVVGGYAAALLLSAAYMSLGLCVSARTDNQVVALMVTLVLGILIYLVGTDSVTSLFGGSTAELLRGLGTGSRFESIERGVLDLRDVAYYGSLTVTFLVLNGVFLSIERLDPGSSSGRARLLGVGALAALTAANAVALNVWLAPVGQARIDLTEGRDYTISPTTRELLAGLDEPIRIVGMFSERTHPKLAPLVPQVRDMLREYGVTGADRVDLQIVDPNDDETLEAELTEQYAIRSQPFGVSDRHSQSVVNAYFHVLVTTGDQFEVLGVQDLIEVRSDAAGMDVKLRNLEYDLTRAIKRVSQQFQTVETLLAKLDGQASVTAYITDATLPEDFADTAAAMRKVAGELAEGSGDKLVFREADPSSDPALQQALYDEFGVRPLAADLFGEQTFYLHLVLEMGEHVERILPRGSLTEGDVRTAMDAALRRGVPGQLKKLGLVTEVPVAPPPNPNLPPQMQEQAQPPDYQSIERMFGEQYEVARVDLTEGFVPDDVDVLLVAKPGRLGPDQQTAIDQYLMGGGAIIALAGERRLQADQTGIRTLPNDTSLSEMLASYGVLVQQGLVMDPSNAPFPQPTARQTPLGKIQSIELIPYPFFPDIRGEQLNEDHPILSGITAMTMPWSSPLAVAADPLEGRQVTWLMESSSESWVNASGEINPNAAEQDPTKWFSPPDGAELGHHILGVAVTGSFPSHVADADDTTLLPKSVADGRVVVLGSSEMASDILMLIAGQTQTESHSGNLQLLMNSVDWAVEDTDLLRIRTAGAFARTLVPLDEAETRAVEIRAALMMGLPLMLLLLAPRLMRRNAQPLPLPQSAAAENTP